MFDIGWTELLLIGIVALIVVGPKDLPRMFAAFGRFTAKMKAMGREFQRAMDDAAKETGVADTAKDLRDMTSKKNLGLDGIEEAAKKFESWEPTKSKPTAASAAPKASVAKSTKAKPATSTKPTKKPASPAKKKAPAHKPKAGNG